MYKKNFAALGVFAAAAAAMLVSCSLFNGLKGKQASEEWKSHFPHKIHVESDMGCAECHLGVDKGGPAGMPPLAAEKGKTACLDCHDEPDKGSALETAINALKERADAGQPLWRVQARPSSDVIFDHSVHMKNVSYTLKSGQSAKLACADCHGDVAGSNELPKNSSPTMDQCTDCHARGKAADDKGGKAVSGAKLNECSVCHSVYRKEVAPADHRGVWRHQHGEIAALGHDAREKKRCGYCHEEGFCSDCHQREKPRSHTNYFRLRGHGIDASLSRERCSVCHLEDFCVRCHEHTRPQSHVGASWATEPYRHCTSCHIPVDVTRCTVCHKSPNHDMAPAYPRDSNHTGNCTMACHTRPHPDTGPQCKICHK